MQGPVRLYLSVREHDDSGLIAAVVCSAILFAATPFLIPVVVSEFGVTLGTSGLLSTAQVGAFAITVFVAGRRLRTRRRYLVVAGVGSFLANALSVFVPEFWSLLAVRLIAGSAAGLMVWLGWAKAMRVSKVMRRVAAAGPLSVFVGAPVVGWLATNHGTDGVFIFLAALSLPVALLPASFAGYRVERSGMSPSRSNLALIGALGLSTLFGSALFVYAGAVGRSLAVPGALIAAAFSVNAFTGFTAARKPSRTWAAVWILGVAICVVMVGLSGNRVLFFVGLAVWGFCFWKATPSVLSAIGEWSLVPDERAGDTQSAMALGRALGPALGGYLVGDGDFGRVAVVSSAGLVVAATIVLMVERYRVDNDSPVP